MSATEITDAATVRSAGSSADRLLRPDASRLRLSDVLAVGSIGMRTRKLRTALTATGVAIGIAALVAVMGISASSRADLLAELDALGTNRLEVQAGSSFTGGTAALSDDAIAMIRRIGPVQAATGTTTVDAERIKKLEQEAKELRRTNAILRSGGCCTNVDCPSRLSRRGRPSWETMLAWRTTSWRSIVSS